MAGAGRVLRQHTSFYEEPIVVVIVVVIVGNLGPAPDSLAAAQAVLNWGALLRC